MQNTYTDDTTWGDITVDKCESRNANNESVVTYTDKLGRVLYVEQPDNKKLQYEYANGKLKTIKNGNDEIIESSDYDGLERLTKHTFNGNVRATVYNNFGQVAKETVRLGETSSDKLEYVYNYKENADRTLAGLTVGAFAESYEQDKNGRNSKISQTFGGKTYTKRFGYYKQSDHATNRVNTIYYATNGVTDGKITYTYDGMGNIISVNENGKQHYKYSYDKLNRLISEKDLYKNEEICYTYDNKGNILTRNEKGTVIDYKYADGTDRLMKFGAESFVYDSMGNPTTYRNMTCVWGNGRQLKSITNGTDTAFYTYDEFGVRTKKINGGVTTNYVYENGKLLREITGSEKIDFIYGAEGAIGFRIGEANYIYRKNIFGDVTEIYDASGTLVGKYKYTAFGVCEITLDTNGIATKNPIRYRGYYYDTETELYYLKSRYYDPELGRFMTIDGIEYIEPDTINGLNLYAYCFNNPIGLCDPSGCSALAALIIGFLLLFTPIGGIVTQAAVSVLGYAGMAIASIFDNDIRNDMNLIGWNPFNTDESLVMGSTKVSFYKGVPVILISGMGGSMSLGALFFDKSRGGIKVLKHERGHSTQLMAMGLGNYLIQIGIPSMWKNGSETPWELSASLLGGSTFVNGKSVEQKREAHNYFIRAIFPLVNIYNIFEYIFY